MVLVAVDDLLFSSKIRATAKQVGVELAFARTPSDILQQARTLKPSLVIFDINSEKADPINTVAALKADPDLKDIPTTGFVSHVNTALIMAARQAGMDEVMARSAFAANLPQILTEKEPRN
jgi:CheY-like chemotaxis protein